MHLAACCFASLWKVPGRIRLRSALSTHVELSFLSHAISARIRFRTYVCVYEKGTIQRVSDCLFEFVCCLAGLGLHEVPCHRTKRLWWPLFTVSELASKSPPIPQWLQSLGYSGVSAK